MYGGEKGRLSRVRPWCPNYDAPDACKFESLSSKSKTVIVSGAIPKLPFILRRYIHLRIESNRCTASRARGDLDQPHVYATAVKEVAATGKLSAPLAVTEAIEADNATGFRCGFGYPGEAEVWEVVTEAEAVEGAAEEEEVEEKESGETDEEEEEGSEEKHDDWFEEKGEEIGGWF
ncbi:hypothetical protein Lal_00040548 [Lupinus albus]|nr:hypothetical protein Lal_00040548 [Lupinus albus]